MGKASSLLLMVCVFLAAVALWPCRVDASGKQELSWVAMKGRCHGSIADCMADDEFKMDNEINRRILATSDYISYGALQRDTVPCSQRGASYYNCQTGAEANPYSRGCSEITRCRS